MSLLREIQAAATDNATGLDTLLRKCRVLASRLQHDDLKVWVQRELDGYFGENVEVPPYRRLHGSCYGHFTGPFGSGLRDAPIAESLIPEDVREMLTQIEMREGVAALEDLLRKSDGNIRSAWPAETSMLFGAKIYQRMHLAQAWIAIPDSFLAAILSTVRNRVLNFALEIESQNPAAGEAPANSIPIPKDNVSQIFNTYVYGNVGNVASGQHIAQTANVAVTAGDVESLVKYLQQHGVAREDLVELKNAIAVDPKHPKEAGYGPRVGAWMGSMIAKAATGAWKVSVSVGSNLLAACLKQYYGL